MADIARGPDPGWQSAIARAIPPNHRPKTRLPESFGWLIRLVPGTAEYAGQVQALLADPETAALLEAAPQAGRTLRPLCRMLAIRLPDALRVPRPHAAPPASTRTVSIRLPTLRPPRHPPGRHPPISGARVVPGQGAGTVLGLPPFPD